MDVFPAFFPLIGRTVVVVGSGEPAEVKTRLFDGSPARVVRIDSAAALDRASYAGAALVFIAGDDLTFLIAARDAAKAAGVPVNVVDRLELCDFTTPALIDRGEVVAAVGTAGASPLLAALLRNDIEARVPQGAGRLAALLRGVQGEVRAALPNVAARRAFLREMLEGPVADAAMAGETERAQGLLRAALTAATGGGPAGRICVIAHASAPDLLSLRAARRLAEADVLVLDAVAEQALASLARRDARRIANAEADLAALAAQGLLVVVAPPPSKALLDALRDAGVRVETLAPAPDAS
jgi:precorrin-2 dehydrogenase/sirohydrochlorin ferrochelatase